ncbi:hypothetical protein DS742_28310 [Lacrimispora amygdalina]|uniref:Uncharacterized protein n=1 Tax=Lacrimispora amygdalina TaxID=253257 RepID=A0A3E2N3M0_9FIRM|nr:hypothetical protein [Clostridium indicum]RFZ75568.1 hypothetical protein DS742_28310 [Clostridium indicum]
MQIGNYKLGRYHAIIEKTWEDATCTYETDFISKADLQESISAIRYCLINGIKCGMDNHMKMIGMKVYKGKEAVEKLKSLEVV